MKTILVPTDFNALATAALRTGVQLARATGAEIVVLYADVFEPPQEFTARQTASIAESIAESRRRAEEELARYAAEIVPDDVRVRTVVREDFAVAAIVDLADELNADLIAMGTHGRGALARLLLGSVAEAVLRETSRPVLTVRRIADANPVRRIGCADDSTSAFASALAASLKATITPSLGEADLIVASQSNRALIRESQVPVLSIEAS